MLERMVEQWDRWSGTSAGARTLRRWQGSHGAMAGWPSRQLRAPRSGARTDRMQAALVSLGQAGEEMATLTLVVQFEPALRRLAIRRQRQGLAHLEATADVVATFVEVVLGHDLRRRPSRIAANLVWDTRQRLDRADRRSAPATGWAMGGLAADWRADGHGWGDTIDLIACVASALDGLGGDEASRRLTRELAVRAWLLGETNAELARRLGLEASAVRARLCRLRAEVRDRYDPVAA